MSVTDTTIVPTDTPAAVLAAIAPGVSESFVEYDGHTSRVWTKGSGPRIGFLAGPLGVPRWTPFLDALATDHQVIVPSLPGFPGGGTSYERLDSIADWVICTLDLLEASGLDGADLVGHSIGGSLLAEVAAFSRATVARLVLVAPYGLYEADAPPANLWAMRSAQANPAMTVEPSRINEQTALPDGGDAVEWPIEMQRAVVAGARLFWPLCDLGLAKRLHRITAPTLLVWGSEDRALAPRYADHFAAAVAGPTTVERIDGAGHLVDLDAPDRLAAVIATHLG